MEMKFAIVNDTRTEATKGVSGICPSCDSELIAKCGEQRIHHWAHKGNRTCDPWWEPETEWHRTWKNNYPAEWQETIMSDEQTSEKHISDVRTIHDLTIEFQHSHINPQERISREKFYKNMVWVVDGTRLQRDYPRFAKNYLDFKTTNYTNVYYADFPDEVFPKNWIGSSVPVVFDFSGLASTGDDEIKDSLWCLFPQKDVTRGIVIRLQKKAFVEITHNRGELFVLNENAQPTPIPIQVKTRLLPSRYGNRRGPLIDYMRKKQFSYRYRSQRKGRR